jgi:hypothetical protein
MLPLTPRADCLPFAGMNAQTIRIMFAGVAPVACPPLGARRNKSVVAWRGAGVTLCTSRVLEAQGGDSGTVAFWWRFDGPVDQGASLLRAGTFGM